MADNHPLFQVQSVNRELLTLVGNYTSGGTGVITLPKGRGYSATRVSTGVVLVTLASSYPTVIYTEAHTAGITAVPNIVFQCSPVVTKSMTISTYATTTAGNVGALTDVPLGYQVHFRLDVLNSSVN